MENTRIGFITANKLREVAPEIISDKGWYKEAGPIFKHGGALLLNTAFEEVPDLGYAPTQSLLQKWFREKGFEIKIDKWFNNNLYNYSVYRNSEDQINYELEILSKDLIDVYKYTYEEALELGLQEALDMLKSTSDKGDSVSHD